MEDEFGWWRGSGPGSRRHAGKPARRVVKHSATVLCRLPLSDAVIQKAVAYVHQAVFTLKRFLLSCAAEYRFLVEILFSEENKISQFF